MRTFLRIHFDLEDSNSSSRRRNKHPACFHQFNSSNSNNTLSNLNSKKNKTFSPIQLQ
jgi:hypothetical protein